jgi:hypothetical protein
MISIKLGLFFMCFEKLSFFKIKKITLMEKSQNIINVTMDALLESGVND